MKKITLLLVTALISMTVVGANWKTTTLENDGSSKLRAMCAFSDTEAMVVGYDSLVYKSYDAGQTWEKITMQPFYPIDTMGIDYQDASSKGDVAMIAVGNGDAPGMLLKSIDKGETWTAILASAFANDSAIDKNPTFDGAYTHRFYAVEVLDDNTALAFMNWKDSTATSRNGIFKTTDGGTSWDICNTPTIEAFDGDIEFIGNTGYFAGTAMGYVFKTTDGGTTWTDYSDKNKYGFIWGIKLLSADELFILGASKLFYSSASDFSDQTSTEIKKSYSTDLLAISKDKVITFHKHDNIWATNNATADSAIWSAIGDGSSNYVRKCDMTYNDTIYALGDGAIYKLAVSDAFAESTDIQKLTADNAQNITISTADDQLNIQSSKMISSVKLFSITGQTVYSLNANSRTITLPTSQFTNGIYIVKADDHTQKIIIK